MPSARSVLPKRYPKKPKRVGAISNSEKELVAQFVEDQPAEITPAQVTALATTMRRSKEAVKALIEEAKENFQSSASRYVEIHKQAVEAALLAGTEKSLAVAVNGAQWAMENLQAEGVSIIGKKQETGSSAGRIMIGIQIGGIRKEEASTTIEAEKI